MNHYVIILLIIWKKQKLNLYYEHGHKYKIEVFES